MEQATVDARDKKNAILAPSIAVVLAAVLLCVSYFLPFTIATEGSPATSEYARSYEISEGSGVMLSELASPSLVTWARAYKAMSEGLSSLVTTDSMDAYMFLFWVIVASGAAAAFALLFALLRKAIPTVLFALVNLGLNSFLCLYFETSGPVSSGAESTWAFGRFMVLGAAGVLAVAGIWLLVAKRAQKRIEVAA